MRVPHIAGLILLLLIASTLLLAGPAAAEDDKFGARCLPPITPDCPQFEELKGTDNYVLNTSTDPNTLQEPAPDPCVTPPIPETCENYDKLKNKSSLVEDTSTDPDTLIRNPRYPWCVEPVTPRCDQWEEKLNSTDYVLDTSTDPNTLYINGSDTGGGLCSVDGAPDTIKRLFQVIYGGYLAITLLALYGYQTSKSIPFVPQETRQALSVWKGRVLYGAVVVYFVAPMVYRVLPSGTLPECISLF